MHERAGPQEPAELQPEEHARVYTAMESKLLRDLDAARVGQKRGAQRGNQQDGAGPPGPRAPGQARPLPQGRAGVGFRAWGKFREPITPSPGGRLLGMGRSRAAAEHTAHGAWPRDAAAGLAPQASLLSRSESPEPSSPQSRVPPRACAGGRRRRASALG